jgi:hypothetical protein
MQTYLAPETAARMAAAAAAFSGALDESQPDVLTNDFAVAGARREWSYLPQPERNPGNDFGDDILAAHYRAEHAAG